MLARAYFFLILSCILWSLNPVANKFALLELAVPQLVFMRTFCTAIVMFVIALCLGYSFKLKQIGWRPFLLGIIDPGLTSLLFVISLTMLSASNTVIIMALMPFSQPILASFFLKEKIQFSIFLGAVIAFIGIALFLSEEEVKNEKGIIGNLILLVVFLLFTISQLMTRKIMLSNISTLVVTSSQMVSATIVMFLNLLFFGNLDLPFIASSGTIVTVIYLVFALAIPFFLYNQAMRYIKVGMASLVLVLIIPFGFLFAAIFLGEKINLIKSIGAIIVMIGVVLPQIYDYIFKKINENNEKINNHA
tara:strand:+ start:175 stop:1089 length:915 start_codon:yes stop_codon:yes gene_type:complete